MIAATTHEPCRCPTRHRSELLIQTGDQIRTCDRCSGVYRYVDPEHRGIPFHWRGSVRGDKRWPPELVISHPRVGRRSV